MVFSMFVFSKNVYKTGREEIKWDFFSKKKDMLNRNLL